MKKTVVLGASPNSERYSYRAVVSLLKKGCEVIPIGIKSGFIENIPIINGTPNIKDVHTITLYLSPDHQKFYFGFILKLNPKRVIFNPGTHNKELMNLLGLNGIEVVEECTLVMLSMGTY
jgi:predicted CoA-binding protein